MSIDWDDLIDEAGVAALLPGDYARFAQPVREGLIHFLGGLSPERQAEALTRQSLLGLSATTAQRLGELARCCPVLHKLGQTIARDRRLAPDLRDQLRPLESLPPVTPLTRLAQRIASELGSLDRLGVRLTPPALAEASVAVVVPFVYGPHHRLRGVFKILKPGIEDRLQQELQLLERVGSYLDDRCHQLKIPELDYRSTFEQVSGKLAWELRLDQEQRHLSLAAQLHANDLQVHVPALLDFCTPRITAMERVAGANVSDFRAPDASDRRRLAELVFRAVVLRPLFARGEAAIFHCDPHPGNLLLGDDGRLSLLDWSLATWLPESDRSVITQIVLAAVTLHDQKIVELLTLLSHQRELRSEALQAVVHARLSLIRRGQPPGLLWLIGLLDEAVEKARLKPPPEMLLFRKSLLTLQGTIRDIDSDFQFDDSLFRQWLRHFLSEACMRLFLPFGSRALPTRTSNADLVELALNAPWAAGRHGLGAWSDLAAALGASMQPPRPASLGNGHPDGKRAPRAETTLPGHSNSIIA
ncbi:MAG: phosphotransferase [Pirellulales bacterium]|nr:phosphotransferase [Pirellulales bacterium]